MEKHKVIKLTSEQVVATWFEKVKPGNRDDAIMTILESRLYPSDYDIMITNTLAISHENIKRKWVSRERGHVYKTYCYDDPEEISISWLTEYEFICKFVCLNSHFTEEFLEYLGNIINKTIEIIEPQG
jgi:hypothetical protein